MDKKEIMSVFVERKQALNFSLGQVRQYTGLSRQQISNIEKGVTRNPNSGTIKKLENFVEKSTHFII